MSKRIFLSCLLGLIGYANASERDVVGGAAQVESAFVSQSTAYTTNQASNVSWPTWLDLKISNKWLFSFNSKYPITISKITVKLGDTLIGKPINLELKAKIPLNYLLSDVNLSQMVQSIDSSYKFMGVFKEISATEFIGFSKFKYQRLEILVSWTDANKNYTEASTEYIMVMAK